MSLLRGTMRTLLRPAVRRIFSVEYNGTTTSAVVSDGAVIQDLADDAFTAEAWVRPAGYGENNQGGIFSKGWSASAGFILLVHSTYGIYTQVFCATTSARSWLTPAELPADGREHHITMFFDDAGDRNIYVAIDGKWASSYGDQTAGVDAIVTDVGEDLYIGNRADNNRTFDGVIGWCRISDNDRHSQGTNFNPPSRLTPPASDGNTVVLYHFDEGTGATADNETGAAAYDATLSNHIWRVS